MAAHPKDAWQVSTVALVAFLRPNFAAYLYDFDLSNEWTDFYP